MLKMHEKCLVYLFASHRLVILRVTTNLDWDDIFNLWIIKNQLQSSVNPEFTAWTELLLCTNLPIYLKLRKCLLLAILIAAIW